MSKYLNISTDNTLGGNSSADDVVSSQKAIKKYVDDGLAVKQDEDTAVNYDNISNCITEIPQDINLTLSNGTLTLKSGSKVYVPNGSGVFDVVNITTDKTTTASANGVYMYFINTSGNLQRWALRDCFSGTTAPTSVHYPMWYDTTNNIIKTSDDYGSTWSGKFSFPIAIVTVSNGVITSIDQVFNGFGYIGSTVFVLPGVKGLVPNGRNADGTLKNQVLSVSSVQTRTYSGTGTLCFLLDTTGYPSWIDLSDIGYKEKENIIYRISNGLTLAGVACGYFDISSNKITSLTPKTVFHAVDYNDYQKTVEKVETNTTNITSKQDEATALNYDNISNCITEIPQDITIVIQANNSLAVKQGSKVYYGDSTYDILDSDKGYGPSTDWGNVPFIFAIKKSDKTVIQATLNNMSSNATNPGIGYRFWFNTTDGKCYINDGQGVASETSFPVGILQHTTGTGWTNINQVFNGFGYIGSTVFALPGVKGLIPAGRNSDGTLKNTTLTISSVKTQTSSTIGNNMILRMYSNGSMYWSTANVYYDSSTNYTMAGSSKDTAACVGTLSTTTGGNITSFATKQVFHSVDYIDNEFIGHQAMPSSRYTDLTLGSTGTTYTAPADGYYTLNKGGNSGEWIYLLNTTTGLNISNLYPATLNSRLFIPVSKGDIIQCQYSASGVTNWFRFIYANGSK